MKTDNTAYPGFSWGVATAIYSQNSFSPIPTLTLHPFTRILVGHFNSEVEILVEPQVKFNGEKKKLGLHLSQTPKLNLELDGAKAVIDLQL